MAASDDQARDPLLIERVQIGARMEKRLVKVLRALAEYHDLSLGDLLEGIVLHAFEGKSPFDAQAQQRIAKLKEIYGVDYGVSASHQFREGAAPLQHTHNEEVPS